MLGSVESVARVLRCWFAIRWRGRVLALRARYILEGDELQFYKRKLERKKKA